MNALAVKPHPHGGFTIARPVDRFGSTARIYEGHFASREEAKSSPLFKTLLATPPAVSEIDHQAHAIWLFAQASKMVQRAEGYRARAVASCTDYKNWTRWTKRAVRAQLATARLLRWGDAAQFRATREMLK